MFVISYINGYPFSKWLLFYTISVYHFTILKTSFTLPLTSFPSYGFVLATPWIESYPTCTLRTMYYIYFILFILELNCPETGFVCDDGQCVSMTSYCDFKRDCNDGSDERDCGITLFPLPKYVKRSLMQYDI